MTKYPKIGIRTDEQFLKQLDVWRKKQDDLPGRPEAIRRLVEIGLKAAPTEGVRSSPNKLRAAELAGNAIDKMADPTANTRERAQRRRRLTKGPLEFREGRIDQPKAKK
jgi:hypothetical protein